MGEKRISTTNIFAKECIVSALLQLTDLKPLSSVTISELCQKAGVSRMTFYRNYASVEDIFYKEADGNFPAIQERVRRLQYRNFLRQGAYGSLFQLSFTIPGFSEGSYAMRFRSLFSANADLLYFRRMAIIC